MKISLGLAISVFAVPLYAKDPDCTDPGAWPAGMAYSQLKNAQIVNSSTLNFGKTKVVRLASEKIGNDPVLSVDLYRQVHQVTFVKRGGDTLTVVTVSDASHQECSMSDVDVYLVSKHLSAESEK